MAVQKKIKSLNNNIVHVSSSLKNDIKLYNNFLNKKFFLIFRNFDCSYYFYNCLRFIRRYLKENNYLFKKYTGSFFKFFYRFFFKLKFKSSPLKMDVSYSYVKKGQLMFRDFSIILNDIRNKSTGYFFRGKLALFGIKKRKPIIYNLDYKKTIINIFFYKNVFMVN